LFVCVVGKNKKRWLLSFMFDTERETYLKKVAGLYCRLAAPMVALSFQFVSFFSLQRPDKENILAASEGS
jgi:hypothetical protein